METQNQKNRTPFSIIISSILFFICCGFSSSKAFFLDVSSDHPNKDAIEYAQSNGIVSGYPDGSFKPDTPINRAEFTKIIMNTQLSFDESNACLSSYTYNTVFPDVSNDIWFAPYVCAAKKSNIIHGYPDGTFKPANFINFAEAAKIISNAFSYPSNEDTPWYKPFVDQLAERNSIPLTLTHFNINITRGEISEIIYRLKTSITTKSSLDYTAIVQMNDISVTTLPIYFSTLHNNENFLHCGKTDRILRTIPFTSAPARASLDQLFQGPTEEEKTNGILDFWIQKEHKDKLKRIFILNGTAYLDWEDIRQTVPNIGTSCGSMSFLAPIEDTLTQFSSINRVIHAIDSQPSVFYEWIQVGCSETDDFCDATPFQVPTLPENCYEEPGAFPVITSLSHYSGPIGTRLKIHGCNFSGFEGDKNIWIENEHGIKGILYGEKDSTSQMILSILPDRICQHDISYSGLPCDNWLSLEPGPYKIYTTPWNQHSNIAHFEIMPLSQ